MIQIAGDTGSIKEMYDRIKVALGPTQMKSDPLKTINRELIKDWDKQMQHWVEHYYELYARENIEEALSSIECLLTLDELAREPSLKEIRKAMKSLASRKAPGNYGISVEVLKCCQESINTELLEILHLCWREGEVPQDMRDANIVILYKNKRDRCDCNNYCVISLLSIVSKLFTRIVLDRLKVLAERVYPDSQCRFCAKKSTTDMVFAI